MAGRLWRSRPGSGHGWFEQAQAEEECDVEEAAEVVGVSPDQELTPEAEKSLCGKVEILTPSWKRSRRERRTRVPRGVDPSASPSPTTTKKMSNSGSSRSISY